MKLSHKYIIAKSSPPTVLPSSCRHSTSSGDALTVKFGAIIHLLPKLTLVKFNGFTHKKTNETQKLRNPVVICTEKVAVQIKMATDCSHNISSYTAHRQAPKVTLR